MYFTLYYCILYKIVTIQTYSWNKLEPTTCVLFLQSMRGHVKSIGFFDFRTCQCYGNMIMIHLSEQINHFGMVPLLTDIYIERKDPRSCFTRMFKPARWCDFISGHLDTCWTPDFNDQASKLTRNGPFAKWLLASPSDLSARPATRHPACGKFLGDMSTTAVD